MLNTLVKERASLEFWGAKYVGFINMAEQYFKNKISWEEVKEINKKIYKLDVFILCWVLNVGMNGKKEKLKKEKNLKYNFTSGKKDKCYIAKCKRRRS